MKGILFRPEMQQAIRDNLKTVTRRIMKPQPDADGGLTGVLLKQIPVAPNDDYMAGSNGQIYSRLMNGEIVYVKAAWAVHFMYDDLPPREIPKQGWKQGDSIWYKLYGNKAFTGQCEPGQRGKWRSPLFMPAWAALDFLQIMSVRPERLQEITEEDAITEGIKADPTIAVYEYSRLWDSINKDYSWTSSPWVWRIEFKRVVKPEGI